MVPRFIRSAGRTALKVVAVLASLNLAGPHSAAAAAEEQPVCRIAVLGDSLTSGYGVALEDGFPAQLEAALAEQGFACEVIDAGVSGDTSAGGRARLGWVLADAPSHLIVELGGNDALRALPVEQLEANLAAIIEQAQAAGVAVFLVGMKAPPNLGRDYTEAFEQVYADLAASYDVPLYPFFLAGVIMDESLMQPDGIHPAAAGVQEIVRQISEPVAVWLRETVARETRR